MFKSLPCSIKDGKITPESDHENPFYTKKSTGFSFTSQGFEIRPLLYQPSPEGIIELCNHYNQKYSIDLRSVDLRNKVTSGEQLRDFFSYLQMNHQIIDIQEGHSRGLILNHGAHHAVPVLICMKDAVRHIIVLDSTSGSRIQGYFKIAGLFPDSKFYLNAGTRQADEGSCITDAICILKQALRIPNLIDLINNKKIINHKSLIDTPSVKTNNTGYVNRFFQPVPNNFNLFKMPEQLLLTAQSSKYIEEAEADLNMPINGERTLEYYRENYRMEVSLAKDERATLTTINSYLYLKSQEHKTILDLRHHDIQKNAQNDDSTIERDTPSVSPSNSEVSSEFFSTKSELSGLDKPLQHVFVPINSTEDSQIRVFSR